MVQWIVIEKVVNIRYQTNQESYYVIRIGSMKEWIISFFVVKTRMTLQASLSVYNHK